MIVERGRLQQLCLVDVFYLFVFVCRPSHLLLSRNVANKQT